MIPRKYDDRRSYNTLDRSLKFGKDHKSKLNITSPNLKDMTGVMSDIPWSQTTKATKVPLNNTINYLDMSEGQFLHSPHITMLDNLQDKTERTQDSMVKLTADSDDQYENKKMEKRKEATNKVSELTGKVLKVCNVVREKEYGSKVLYKQTGTICGAR